MGFSATLDGLHAALYCLAATRDPQAWGFLLEKVGPDIERLAARLTGDQALAEDAVQETLLQIRDHAGQFRQPERNPDVAARRWILGVAANVSANLVRKRARLRKRERAGAMTPQAAAHPGQRTDANEQEAAVRTALAELPNRHRMAIVLHCVVGLGFPEVAAELGCPASTVKDHVYNGLERMRKYLGRLGIGLSVAAVAGVVQELPAATVATNVAAQISLLSSPVKASVIPISATFSGVSIAMKCALVAALVLVVTSATYLVGAQGGDGDKGPQKNGVKRSGPLADMPSKPGPHIDKIKALGDGEWVNIGKAAPDPKWGEGSLRSWGCKWPYASDVGGAFVSAAGSHAWMHPDGRYDDIFFLDINALKWVCIYPGLQTKTFVDDVKTGKIKVGDKGYLVDQNGDPVHAYGMHNYQNTAYDPDRHVYTTLGWANGGGGDNNKDFPGFEWQLPCRTTLADQANACPAYKEKGQQWLPYCFDTTTGKWTREGPYGHFYVPSKKDYFTYWNFQTIFSKTGPTNPKGPQAPMVTPGVCDYGGCFDSKRERIYLLNVGGGDKPLGNVFIYDVATNTWTEQPSKGGTLEYAPATCNGVVHYDTVNDRMVVMYRDSSDVLTGISVWDPETFIWEPKQPLPKAITDAGMLVGFYCPEYNAHFVMASGDNIAKDWWVYRYKNPKSGDQKKAKSK